MSIRKHSHPLLIMFGKDSLFGSYCYVFGNATININYNKRIIYFIGGFVADELGVAFERSKISFCNIILLWFIFKYKLSNFINIKN